MDTRIDLRSDTVTQPTAAMRDAMMAAPLGDDVLGDEPTVIKLQEKIAELLGKEAALFVPSGSMANMIAIRSQTEPGDEIIAHEFSHIYQYEGGGYAALAGCSIRLLQGDRGLFNAIDVQAGMRPVDAHFPQSKLVVIENTQNKGGGTVWPIQQIKEVTAKAHDLGCACHLDGARLMNACVASNIAPAEYAQHFDSVSMCFSKGLGAPVGSILAGSNELIGRAHRFRKMFGGGMRQSGLLAAAAIYALDHHVDRLAEDHQNAKRIAEALADLPGISVDLESVETNIIYFNLDDSTKPAPDLAQRLESAGLRSLATGNSQIRFVTHLDVSNDQVDRAIQILQSEMGG